MAYNLETAQAQLANLVQSDYTQQDLLDLVRQIDITAEGDLTDQKELTNAFIIANKRNTKFTANTVDPANPTTTSATTRKLVKILEFVALYARNSIGFFCPLLAPVIPNLTRALPKASSGWFSVRLNLSMTPCAVTRPVPYLPCPPEMDKHRDYEKPLTVH